MIDSEIKRSLQILIRQIESSKWGFSKKTAAKYVMMTQFLTNQVATFLSDIFCRIMLFTLVISSFIVVVVILRLHTHGPNERAKKENRNRNIRQDGSLISKI